MGAIVQIPRSSDTRCSVPAQEQIGIGGGRHHSEQPAVREDRARGDDC